MGRKTIRDFPTELTPQDGQNLWVQSTSIDRRLSLGTLYQWILTKLNIGTAANRDTGLAADQIPLNSNLGSAAYIAADAVQAVASDQVFVNTTDGLAATAEGQYFWVPSGGNMLLYRKVSSAAVLQTTEIGRAHV